MRIVIGFVISIIVGRGLGPGEFGRWAFLMAWAAALTMAFDLGMGTLVTRDAARGDGAAGPLVASAIVVRLAIFAPFGVAISLAAPWLESAGSTSAVRAVIWLAAAGMAYGCFGALFRASPLWLTGILSIETAGAAAQAVATLWIVRRGGPVVDLLWMATLVQVLQISAAAVLWRALAREDGLAWPSWRSGRALVRRAFPFALSGIVANAQVRVAPLLLGHLSSAAEVGAFAVAARLSGAATLLPHSGFAAALPVLTREVASGDPAPTTVRFEGILRRFAVAAALGLALFAEPIISLTYGRAFLSASPALRWLAIGLAPMLINSGRKVYLYASAQERIAVGWSAVALAIQVAGCAALVPWYGAAGAACAMTLGEAAIWWPLRAQVVRTFRSARHVDLQLRPTPQA